ncbi:SURF1 family protein [Thalassotalea sp. PP2-459]|uniref:SURF1 family protein n=1 Tax=Thalassotalea sp. PP2-459 TaxID=1742724 RepID=UPI000941F52E|nr:SURF1 family protein [Thalassotalea sp. PP2-459]OKY26662.1 hypothetical protein BI291_01325 [Thalassotalea sp. PP2-459]
MKVAKLKDYLYQLNWLLVTLTLLVFIGLIKLGLWQVSRAVEKEQRIERIADIQQKEQHSLVSILSLIDDENINDLPVAVVGRFDSKHVFLHDNQTHQGQVGYRVLQVLTSEYGSVLVNLGWIKGDRSRQALPIINPVEGTHKINGHIRMLESGFILSEQVFSNVSWPLIAQQVNLNKFSQLIGQKLLPFVIYLDKTESIGFEKNWQPIVMPPEKHRGYAFQWFSLALAWLVLMLSASIWFYNNKIDNNNKKDPNVSSKK